MSWWMGAGDAGVAPTDGCALAQDGLPVSVIRAMTASYRKLAARSPDGAGVGGLIRERLEEHGLEQSPISQRLDQAVTASVVLEDLDATAISNPSGVDEVKGIVGAHMDLIPGLSWL